MSAGSVLGEFRAVVAPEAPQAAAVIRAGVAPEASQPAPLQVRTYRTGERLGQPYAQSKREHGARRGFNDAVDISGLAGQTYESIIGHDLVVRCVGRRSYVAKAHAKEFQLDEDDQPSALPPSSGAAGGAGEVI